MNKVNRNNWRMMMVHWFRHSCFPGVLLIFFWSVISVWESPGLAHDTGAFCDWPDADPGQVAQSHPGFGEQAARVGGLVTAQGLVAAHAPVADDPVRDDDDPVRDDDDPSPTAAAFDDQLVHFLRVRRDASRQPVAMETSVTRYVKQLPEGDALSVDLIGVVHVGEQEYFEKLNEIFEGYDVVLYELVAPEGTRIPRGGAVDDGLNPLAALQRGMKNMLELDFQLDHIDYMQENLVHADMTPEEFLESMQENEESFLKMALRAVGQSLAMQGSGGTSDAEMLRAMFARDRAQRMRRIFAEQMQSIESGMVMFEGRDGSTIIHHRNRKAFSILDREIENGHRTIGVFYGAGHLPHMEDMLVDERGMRRAGQYWLEAWNLRGD